MDNNDNSNALHTASHPKEIWYELYWDHGIASGFRKFANTLAGVAALSAMKDENKGGTIKVYRCQREEVTWTLGSGSM